VSTAKTLHILNLGAGVQSTALYLMSHRGDEAEFVPRFDYAIFADTQEEPKAVYEHLEWLKSLDGPPILTGTAGKLGDDLIRGFKRSRPGKTAVGFKQFPAFLATIPGEKEGRAERHCTGHYKIDVVTSVIRREILGIAPRHRVPGDVMVVQYFGLSHDEPMRIVKVQDRFRKVVWARPEFPLWDLEYDRSDCDAYNREVVPDRAIGQSACSFCPFRRNPGWRKLRDEDPESWARAVAIDRALRKGAVCAHGLDKSMYLHRSCVPLEEADIDVPESPSDQRTFGFASECEGMCGL
jgi:hypothetical protein